MNKISYVKELAKRVNEETKFLFSTRSDSIFDHYHDVLDSFLHNIMNRYKLSESQVERLSKIDDKLQLPFKYRILLYKRYRDEE